MPSERDVTKVSFLTDGRHNDREPWLAGPPLPDHVHARPETPEKPETETEKLDRKRPRTQKHSLKSLHCRSFEHVRCAALKAVRETRYPGHRMRPYTSNSPRGSGGVVQSSPMGLEVDDSTSVSLSLRDF